MFVFTLRFLVHVLFHIFHVRFSWAQTEGHSNPLEAAPNEGGGGSESSVVTQEQFDLGVETDLQEILATVPPTVGDEGATGSSHPVDVEEDGRAAAS